MPKVATFEPLIIDALRQAGMAGGTRGVGVAELIEVCGCSRTQVYKTLGKLTRAGMVAEVGKTATGAKLWAWAGETGEMSLELDVSDGDVVIDLRLDDTLRVVGLRKVDERVIVEMRDQAGRVLGFTYEPGVAMGRAAS